MGESRAAPVLGELPLEEIEVALIGSMAREERGTLNPVEQARACATLKDELNRIQTETDGRLTVAGKC